MISILQGDAVGQLQKLPDESVQCCVTSPPYWGLRDYGVEGQLGLEKTPQEYVQNMVSVFREVRRVIRNDGTLWLNLGDSYSNYRGGKGQSMPKQTVANSRSDMPHVCARRANKIDGLKEKDLVGIPWRVAFALQSDGWYLRSDIIWAKENCMPESVKDRPTRSHEYLFLLSKNSRYYYDADSIKEPCIWDVNGTGTAARKARSFPDQKSFPTTERNGLRNAGFKNAEKFNGKNGDKQRGHTRRHEGFNARWGTMEKADQCSGMRNKRDVWTVAPANYPDAHFATYPPALITPCILAGTPPPRCSFRPVRGKWNNRASRHRTRPQGGSDRIECGIYTTHRKALPRNPRI